MTASHTHSIWLGRDGRSGAIGTAYCAEGPSCAVERLKEAEELIRDLRRYCTYHYYETTNERSAWKRAEAFLDSMSSDASAREPTAEVQGGHRGSQPSEDPSEDSQSTRTARAGNQSSGVVTAGKEPAADPTAKVRADKPDLSCPCQRGRPDDCALHNPDDEMQ